MSDDNLYAVEEDSTSYDKVCDIRKKHNRTNTDVLEAFSGLECPGNELHEWESYSKLYKSKFKKAKECVQRRITRMKSFAAKNNNAKTRRRKHIYPILVAYAYGQDCLKKIASKADQKTFKNTTNALIKKVAEKQPNVQNYFKTSINNSIANRSDTISEILQRTYYDSDRAELIDKTRRIGYDKLTDDEKELFFSIIDEGFSRNTRYNEELNRNNVESIAPAENEKPELINIIKKEIKKRRKTKKKSIGSVSRFVNTTNINAILQSDAFKITNEEKRADIIKKIDEIKKIVYEKVLLDEKYFLLKDIYYGTFLLKTDLNDEMKMRTYGVTSLKSIKASGFTAKNLPKFEAYFKRNKLGADLYATLTSINKRVEKIIDDILNKTKTGNAMIDTQLLLFIRNDLYYIMLNETNKKIDLLNSDTKEKLIKEKNDLYSILDKIHEINEDYLKQEDGLRNNLLKQTKAEQLLVLPQVRNVPERLEKAKNTLKELKAQEVTLQKNLIKTYELNTDTIQDLYKQVSRKFDNIYILKDTLERLIESLKTYTL